jgi:hypothetical protein
MASNLHTPYVEARPRAQSEVLLHEPVPLSPELYANRFSEPDVLHPIHTTPPPKQQSFLQQPQSHGITFTAQPKVAKDDIFASKSLPRIHCFADPRTISTSDNGYSPTSVLENPFTPRGSLRRSHKKRSSPLHRHSHRSNRSSNQHQQQHSLQGAQQAAQQMLAAHRQMSNLSNSARWSLQEPAGVSSAPATPCHDVHMSEQCDFQQVYATPSHIDPRQLQYSFDAAVARSTPQPVTPIPQSHALPAAAATMPQQVAHLQQQQQQREQQPAASHYDAAPAKQTYSTATPGCVLAVSPHLPGAMSRSVWGIQDYSITQKMYTGYASTVYKVS